ncbi:MAG: hypothetical protein PWQ70_2970 [Clostridiales bacterium]|nr:hypothetical protein [Clostridiales bacterium]
MEWLGSEIGSILINIGKNSFKSFWGKIKLFCIKKELNKKLFHEVLDKYGNRPFYNELDKFLSTNKVFHNVIINCESTPIHQYKSRSHMIHYYVQLFAERYPNYTCYQSEIYSIIQRCFDVIYSTLNDMSSDENVRIISNIAKELAGELSIELTEIKGELCDINNKIDTLLVQSESESDNVNNISLEQYFEYLARLYREKKNSDFIPRSLYFKDEEDKDVDALEALLKDRHILLLGEAGYGKTYESIDLLSKVCTTPKANDLLPFYLPLYEYGTIYSSIIEGIKYKINPFCEGDSENLVRQWLANGQVVLILDGVDDIQTTEARNKFIAEVKNIALQYEQCYLFITSRFNRYHGELGNISQYYLRGLSRDIIRKQLRDENIHTEIPDSYFQLFENPMFFNIGKMVLKQSHHRELFNRSILFEEMMIMLCGEWDKKKGISNAQPLSYADIIGLLGQYAFDTFCQPSTRLLEFDQYVSKSIMSENKSLIINTLLGCGVLRVTDKITFAHKLFKEYCAAYHMVHTYPLSENYSMYLDLIKRDNWKEVFVFASGMYNNIEHQDEFLDFIMNNNLQLYIECINAKSDLSAQLPSPTNNAFVKRYLEQIVKTYTFIVDKYFQPLKFYFDPKPGKAEENIVEKKIRIVGYISHNGEHLSYWFDRVMPNEEDVLCINENQIAEYHKCRERRAIVEQKDVTSHFVNLKNSGLVGDSGRKVAIDKIKEEIKSILEHKKLIESKYLLCERLEDCKRKIKEIKDLSDLTQMYTIVENMIQKATEGKTNLVGYNHNGIDMFYLHSLLRLIIDNNINYNDCLLPREDTRPNKSSCWTWELYSDAQKANRISKFFYFHQLSYLEMVEANFPVLCHKFSRYLDAPYQNIVFVYLKEDREQKDMHSEQSLTYYYIASPTDYPVPPQLRYLRSEDELNDHSKEIYNEIMQSYLKQGKEAHRLEYTRTGFTFTTTSRKFSGNTPLSDYVYASIKSSLEEIFGKF